MSNLTVFRDHAKRMSTADHKDECPSVQPDPPRWVIDPDYTALRWIPGPPKPTCDGCVTDGERALWQRLADEVDDYLEPHPELFST